MKIEITDYSQIEGYGTWYKERITLSIFDQEDNQTMEFMCNVDGAKKIAQELQHAVNKLLHWAEKREEEEE
jgi:hypothetical protein